MPLRSQTSMQSRVILFVAIVGLAMIVAALLFAALPAPEDSQLTARHLRATADALDVRATEIAEAATRLVAGPRPDPAQTPAPPLPVPENPSASRATSRQSPVALGESRPTADGLLIRVLEVDFDAWERVLAENQFNDPPAEGMRMVMAKVEVTNSGGDPNTPRNISYGDYRMVGERGIVYTPFESTTRCGVIPEELDWQLFRDATITGNVCVVIPADESELRLIYQPGYEWNDQVVYFDLGG